MIAGIASIVILFVLTCPAIYVAALANHGGIETVWGCLIPAYVALSVALLSMIALFDWEGYSEKVRQREEAAIEQQLLVKSTGIKNEESLLL